MKYQEYKGLDLVGAGKEVLEFWNKNHVFEKSVTEKEGNPSFTFYEGPPSANGMPGIHHVMARAVKDIFCRYKTLKGFQVKRKGGWDTHGLPVELKVEKDLGITKEDIGTKITVEEYNQKCREAVMKFTDAWDDLTQKMGYWVDLDDPYVTYNRNYVESLWALLKKLYDKGLLYKGYTIQPYSPAAGTGLSSHELNMPGCYRDVKDTSVVAQFKVVKNEQSVKLFANSEAPVYFLAWTTTPWTLPSNSALAVGEKITYAQVNTFNPYTFEPASVILAKDLLGKFFTEKQKKAVFADYSAGDKVIPYEIAAEFTGNEIVGMSYEQLMPYVQPKGEGFKVIPGDFVSTEDGTGIVHIAPTFGADDQRVAQKAGISAILVEDENGKEVPLVDKRGRFVSEVTDFAGFPVKEEYASEDENFDKPTDVLIAIKLKEENKAFKVEKYEHSYPHCWRTDKPVLYYPLDSWFIKTTEYKDKMVELNKTINWKPASTGSGRFGNWLENLVDWNLSRSRFWGTPLPVWRNEDGSEEVCIGSIAQLNEEVKKAVAAGVMPADSKLLENGELKSDFDLHRPFVDDVVLVSPTGEPMRREPDLIDVWFDSGAMPYAQWHYPLENEDTFKASFPADFIAEGVDQTRGWFFTLHALGVMLEDSVAFKNVISNGLVLDSKGNKMSKRLNNAVDPFETLEKYGPDATRWYMISNANPWENLKFNQDGIQESQRKFFGTLYNTYSFFALYANLDGFNFSEESIPLKERTESDQWIISKLNSLIKAVDEAYADYEPTKAARLIQSFTIDDLSNWYVRQNRKRFWKDELGKNKVAAYQTLYTCLKTIAKLMSPVAPFYADKLYNDLNAVSEHEGAISVHLSDFPQADASMINIDLEEKMELAQNISSLVHSLRKKEAIKVRQPLSRVLIPDLNEKLTRQIKDVESIILSEVNIKKVEYIDDSSGILVKKIKPNFRKLGQQYGRYMKDINAAISQFGQAEISQIEKTNSYSLTVQDQEINLTLDDVEITSEDIPGWSIAKDNGLTVALDVTISEELKKEGVARDLVNKVQNQRKDMGLEVQDKIYITVEKNEALVNDALEIHKGYVCAETQALELSIEDSITDGVEMDLDDFKLNVKIRK
ncbi:isoleucine--tRNA ligase [Flammeovirgaceae bacterium SG7u.111]|nr:isoleucine--tRNA ligase [Flammeovirgaceae bacterium SG7u.132]WPO35495.1 isoleucine--tRNA ligase [Flammeovirgaceae bacterium SG7u.111]